ncbi:MAG: class II aldolase/adducin family protein [Actinomycetota bacterium]|nr:class II aldolase/adducin family protein [Actinomycetota bacterium]
MTGETVSEGAPQSAAQGFVTRTPPVFDSVHDERAHVVERLAGVCRIFGRAGFSEGLLGHVTVRDPENRELFWANPLGISFNRIKVSDLVQVDHDGNLVVGERPVNPVGVKLHSAIHRARPDVNAVCHAHSTYGSAWSAFGRPVAPITQDTAAFHGDQAIIREPRIAMDEEQADRFAASFGEHKVGIQVGHGIFSTGSTVDEAAWWFIGLDKACHVQLLAEAAGDHEVWPDEAAGGVRTALGSSMFGWLSFQTLWDEIVEDCPDFLE